MSGISQKEGTKNRLFIWNREYLEVEKDNGVRRNSQFVKGFTKKTDWFSWSWEVIKP